MNPSTDNKQLLKQTPNSLIWAQQVCLSQHAWSLHETEPPLWLLSALPHISPTLLSPLSSHVWQTLHHHCSLHQGWAPLLCSPDSPSLCCPWLRLCKLKYNVPLWSRVIHITECVPLQARWYINAKNPTNINTQFLLHSCVCVRACVCACLCVFVHIILYVNRFGRTVLHMCIEYCV